MGVPCPDEVVVSGVRPREGVRILHQPHQAPGQATAGAPLLTIGMACYRDFDGVYFTVQALRMYHDLDGVELLVADNGACPTTRAFCDWAGVSYHAVTDVRGTAAPRDLVFARARGDFVLCLDCHVLLWKGALANLRAYLLANPLSDDLLQGPLVYDDLRQTATHMRDEWREQMWGVWDTDVRGMNPSSHEPFDIPLQGLGLFAMRRQAWPGFNPKFRGFGGEEGYIHEKVRQRGGRCLCLPWLRWVHRFGRPGGPPYTVTVEEKLRNYLIGHDELGLDLAAPVRHFAGILGADRVRSVTRNCLGRYLDVDGMTGTR